MMIDQTKPKRAEYVKKSLPAAAFELGSGAVDCCRLFSMMVVEGRKERKNVGVCTRGQKNERNAVFFAIKDNDRPVLLPPLSVGRPRFGRSGVTRSRSHSHRTCFRVVPTLPAARVLVTFRH